MAPTNYKHLTLADYTDLLSGVFPHLTAPNARFQAYDIFRAWVDSRWKRQPFLSTCILVPPKWVHQGVIRRPYGAASVPLRKIFWMMLQGQAEVGDELLYSTCRDQRCVNPNHLTTRRGLRGIPVVENDFKFVYTPGRAPSSEDAYRPEDPHDQETPPETYKPDLEKFNRLAFNPQPSTPEVEEQEFSDPLQAYAARKKAERDADSPFKNEPQMVQDIQLCMSKAMALEIEASGRYENADALKLQKEFTPVREAIAAGKYTFAEAENWLLEFKEGAYSRFVIYLDDE